MRSNVCAGQGPGFARCLARGSRICAQPIRRVGAWRLKAAFFDITEILGIVEELPASKRCQVLMALYATQNDLVTTQNELVKAKSEIIAAERRASRSERTAATEMFLVGVSGGRSMLDTVKDRNTPHALPLKDAWFKMLADDELLNCILDGVPAWAWAVKDKPKHAQRSIVAGNIATVHGGLSDAVHRFVPEAGLMIYEGVPDTATTVVLRCVCAHNGIPYEVQKPVPALARNDDG